MSMSLPWSSSIWCWQEQAAVEVGNVAQQVVHLRPSARLRRLAKPSKKSGQRKSR